MEMLGFVGLGLQGEARKRAGWAWKGSKVLSLPNVLRKSFFLQLHRLEQDREKGPRDPGDCWGSSFTRQYNLRVRGKPLETESGDRTWFQSRLCPLPTSDFCLLGRPLRLCKPQHPREGRTMWLLQRQHVEAQQASTADCFLMDNCNYHKVCLRGHSQTAACGPDLKLSNGLGMGAAATPQQHRVTGTVRPTNLH